MRRVRAIVSGRVQGVGYRYSCVWQAEGAGLTGWVRNRSDGTVETVLEGSDEAVERVLRWLHEGPAGARVDGVAVWEENPAGERGFTVR